MEQVVGIEPTIKGFADLRLCPLGYTRERKDKGEGMKDENKERKIPILSPLHFRLYPFNLARTTGFEPAISNLKGWWLNQFAYVLKCARKDLNFH